MRGMAASRASWQTLGADEILILCVDIALGIANRVLDHVAGGSFTAGSKSIVTPAEGPANLHDLVACGRWLRRNNQRKLVAFWLFQGMPLGMIRSTVG